MYRQTSFLSPAKVPSGVTKKVPWAGQGPVPKKSPPILKGQSTTVWWPSVQARASLVKRNFTSKSMEVTLRAIAEDIWASLGPGSSESVYHCAFEVALRKRNLYYETERIIPVFYEGLNVGNVRADLIIDKRCVVELKSVSKLNETYRIQTRNYLNLLGLHAAYLINFPDKLGTIEFERIEKLPDPIVPALLSMY